MWFSLDVIPARKGDCLMLHYGTKDQPHLVMIDGGPKSVYGPHLRPRITQVRQARGVAATKPLPVDLLMVSHVDDDHIQGILDLTKELITAELEHKPPLLQVFSFWHNSFDNIIGSEPKELTASFQKRFGEASMNGEPPSDLTVDSEEHPETILSTLKVLASIQQGAQLRSDVNRLAFPLNPEFDGELIVAKKKGQALDMEDGLTLTVVGPMLPEVKALHAKHQEWLKNLKKQGKTPEEVLSAYVDKSVPNLSSIVVLAQAGGKRILLTGDARGDKILEGLELVGLVKKGGTLRVDVLKVPHHGSDNNAGPDFFKRIIADHYVFSGNGEHGNPERATLQMLLDARGEDEAYTIHLTYAVDEIDKGRKEDWKKEQGKEKKKQVKHPKQQVRPNWSAEKHSLKALFTKHAAFGKKVRFVKQDQPHVIDLLEKIGF